MSIEHGRRLLQGIMGTEDLLIVYVCHHAVFYDKGHNIIETI